MVGGESVGKGIAFGLEHEAFLVVLAEGLVEGGCAGVRRNEEDAKGRGLGFIQFLLVFGCIVGGKLLIILCLLFLVLRPEGLVNGFRNSATEGEATFSCRCVAGYEEKEVGVKDKLIIFSAGAGEAGRYDGQGAEEEQVGVFGGFLTGDDLLEEVGQRIR